MKLIDVYPETRRSQDSAAISSWSPTTCFRGRFRKSFEQPEPIVPNHTDEYTIDLHTQNHRFLKGHRIMVQVQSTWFPLIDRNPQTFVPNIFKAKDSDFKAATSASTARRNAASYIQLPIAGGPVVP